MKYDSISAEEAMGTPLNGITPAQFIDWIRVTSALMALGYSSWRDWKTREVEDAVWIALVSVGALLNLLQISISSEMASQVLLSIVVAFVLGLALYYVGFFGGADAKAMICLGVVIPKHPLGWSPVLGVNFTLFPLSVLSNSALISALTVIPLFVNNLVWKFIRRRSLFDGFEHDALGRRLATLFTGYKAARSDLEDKPFLYVLEDRSQEIPHLRVRLRVEDFDRPNLSSLQQFVWVSPALPFILFISGGTLVALLLGDLVIWLVAGVIGKIVNI